MQDVRLYVDVINWDLMRTPAILKHNSAVAGPVLVAPNVIDASLDIGDYRKSPLAIADVYVSPFWLLQLKLGNNVVIEFINNCTFSMRLLHLRLGKRRLRTNDGKMCV